MNIKRPYKTDWHPAFLYEVQVESGSKTYVIIKGTWLSVHRKTGLPGGKYEFLYAENVNGVLLLHVEGRMSQAWKDRRRKIIREADIKTVHVKTRNRE